MSNQEDKTLFAQAYQELKEDSKDQNESNSYLVINTTDTKEHVELNIELGDFTKEELRVSLFNNTLLISGERENLEPISEEKNMNIKFKKFRRFFELSEHLDQESIEAIFTKGNLKILIRKLDIPQKRDKLQWIKIRS